MIWRTTQFNIIPKLIYKRRNEENINGNTQNWNEKAISLLSSLLIYVIKMSLVMKTIFTFYLVAAGWLIYTIVHWEKIIALLSDTLPNYALKTR